jgi:hypothetical protein
MVWGARGGNRPSPCADAAGCFGKAGGIVATLTTLPTDFVDAVAAEMAHGVEAAVEHWLAQIDFALTDRHLTTLGRLNAVQEVLQDYMRLTGKVQLKSTRI